jgi:transcriptional regulator with XRE-family HTH domain
MRLQDMLKAAREKAGLTQVDLAERTGLPLRSIQNWESGHRSPRVRTVVTLAKVLKVPVEKLLLALAESMPEPEAKKRKGK